MELKQGRRTWSQKVRHNPRPRPSRTPIRRKKARGGEIILNTPLRRWVFVGGLVGAVVLALLLSLVH